MIKHFGPICPSQNLQFLDVSQNSLQSASLGSQTQLPNLVNLSLAFNPIKRLEKNDFSFLSNSTSLQVLNLTSVPLKTVRNNFCGKREAKCQVSHRKWSNFQLPIVFLVSV